MQILEIRFFHVRKGPNIGIKSNFHGHMTQGRRSKVRAGGARLEKGHLRPWYKLKKGIYSTRKPLTPLIPPNSPELGHFEIWFSLQQKHDVLMGLKIIKWLKECTVLVWNQFGPLFTTYRTPFPFRGVRLYLNGLKPPGGKPHGQGGCRPGD